MAAVRGHVVRVVERTDAAGGVAAIAGPGGPFVDWLLRECERLGVTVELGTPWSSDGGRVVQDGTHDELIALGGRYATLFGVQADRYRDVEAADA